MRISDGVQTCALPISAYPAIRQGHRGPVLLPRPRGNPGFPDSAAQWRAAGPPCRIRAWSDSIFPQRRTSHSLFYHPARLTAHHFCIAFPPGPLRIVAAETGVNVPATFEIIRMNNAELSLIFGGQPTADRPLRHALDALPCLRSEEHTSELQ